MVNITSIDLTTLSIAEAKAMAPPLLLFIAGIVIYSIFIFKFYRFLAKKDIFGLNLQQYSKSFLGSFQKFLNIILYAIEYLIIFPLFTFFWFSIIALILMLLAKSQDPTNILLIAVALVASIRVTSYYSEELSKDLAKMFPFALLAVFLIDIAYFSLEGFLTTVRSFPFLWKQMIYYLGFIILLEFVLRIVSLIFSPLKKEKNKTT